MLCMLSNKQILFALIELLDFFSIQNGLWPANSQLSFSIHPVGKMKFGLYSRPFYISFIFRFQNVVLSLLVVFSSETVSNTIMQSYEHNSLGSFHDAHFYKWESFDMQMLTKKTNSGLDSNGFHIINATIRQTSYIIHLSKTQGMFHPPSLGISNEEVDKFECIYSGTVSEVSNGMYSSNQGIASFSTCHHNNGFEGLILFPHVQYFIRPSASVKNSEQNEISPHKLHKIDFSNGRPGSVDVVMEAPHLAVREAIKEQSKHWDKLPDEDSIESDIPAFMSAEPDSHKRILSKRQTSKRKPKASGSSSKSKIIEIAVFTDSHLYKTWKSRYPKDTITKLNQYVLAVINNMNALYSQPSMTEGINFRLVHVEIEKTQPRNLPDHGGEQNKYLDSFCNFAAEKNLFGSYWDHALLLTGIDILDAFNNLTQGLAYVGTMCTNSLSCSLIEASKFVSPFVTAHEIAHSLGVNHDGSGVNLFCGDTYIMSPSTGAGKLTWSTCSMQNLREFISKGYGWVSAPKCLTKKGLKSGDIKFSSNKKPGQQFPPKEQCEAECTGCTPHQTGIAPYHDMCYLLYCKQNAGFFVFYIPTHPALEGSSCGNGRVCKLGKCQ